MMLIAVPEGREQSEPDRRSAAYQRIVRWWDDLAGSGKIVGGHELEPSSTATTVRLDENGGATVVDGPFVEAKEMLGGYAILDVGDLDAALAIASSWPGAPAVLEIRPLVRGEGG
jgi:hypothetical protein